MASQKRKFHHLLESLGQRPSPSSSEPPTKSLRLTSSTTSLPSTTTSTPLSRTAAVAQMSKSQLRASLSRSRSTSSSIEKPTYLPADRDEFLRRLESYRNIRDWMPKPSPINEVAWAKRGWKCAGADRVRCVSCNVEVVVRLHKSASTETASEAGEGKEQEKEKEKPKLVSPDDVEKALVEKYKSLITESHNADCPWKKRGCDDAIYRQPIYPVTQTLSAFKSRYQSLVAMGALLPEESVFKLPSDFSLQHITSLLPPDFLVPPQPEGEKGKAKPTKEQIRSSILSHVSAPSTPTPVPEATSTLPPPPPPELNIPALLLSLFGFHPRPAYVPKLGSVDCHLCFRNIGLWLHRPNTTSGAPGKELDLLGYHREYCPWVCGETQNPAGKVKGAGRGERLAIWRIMIQILEQEAKKGKEGKNGGLELSRRGSGNSFGDDGEADEEWERVRREKEREQWGRLARIKMLFRKKGDKVGGKK